MYLLFTDLRLKSLLNLHGQGRVKMRERFGNTCLLNDPLSPFQMKRPRSHGRAMILVPTQMGSWIIPFSQEMEVTTS